jgi:hypothetical protein
MTGLNGKNVKGGDCDLRYYSSISLEEPQTTSVRIDGFRAKIRAWDLPNMITTFIGLL